MSDVLQRYRWFHALAAHGKFHLFGFEVQQLAPSSTAHLCRGPKARDASGHNEVNNCFE